MNTTEPCMAFAWVDKNQVATIHLLATCLILTVILNIGLMIITWKRCSNAEDYGPKNLIMYGAGASNMVTSVGVLVYIIWISNHSSCDKYCDDIVYFVAFPALILRELLIACFAINRYAVCVYGLTYHLKMDAKKMGIIMLMMCVLLYTCLIVIHQVTRSADHNAVVSLTASFKITWVACEIAATSLLCIFNLLLYTLAMKKARKSRRVMPLENADARKESHDLFVQNFKRITYTLFASLFFTARMLPHAIVLLISIKYSIDVASRIILLVKLILGVMDPIVQCISIKMIKEGLHAEWLSIRTRIADLLSK